MSGATWQSSYRRGSESESWRTFSVVGGFLASSRARLARQVLFSRHQEHPIGRAPQGRWRLPIISAPYAPTRTATDARMIAS